MTIVNSSVPFVETDKRDLDDLPTQNLGEAYRAIKENYYGFSTLQKDTIVEGMIKGMMESLKDKHSLYFDPSETQEFNQTIKWNFEGIWAYVGKTQSGVLVRTTFDGSPAKLADIQDGDIITLVNKESVLDLDLETAVRKIRWPSGTEVELQIARPSENWKTYTKKVVRRSVKVPSVVSKITDDKIGIITVGIFGESTPNEFLQAYMNLTGSGMKGLVVDLRDNPGGLLSSATSLLQNFIPEGQLLVETKSNSQELQQKYFSEGPGGVSLPMVVLINENSASASEIFAGAIQDYNRGIIIGTKSYGKGSVQVTYPLRNDGELKITVAKWYTPKERGIDGTGILPDIESKIQNEDYENKYDRVLDEGTKTLKKLIWGTQVLEIKK